MDPFFAEEARRLEQVAALAGAELDQLRRMLAEGVYLVTLHTRTQQMHIPVPLVLANGLVTELAADAEGRRDTLQRLAEQARVEAAKYTTIA